MKRTNSAPSVIWLRFSFRWTRGWRVLRTRQTLQILGSRAHDADAVIRARPARHILQVLIQAKFRIGPA
jgi:hypothetical protein